MTNKPTSVTKETILDDPLYVILDAGNEFVKAMKHLAWNKEIIFPHRVWKVSDEDYSKLKRTYARARNKFEESSIFKSNIRTPNGKVLDTKTNKEKTTYLETTTNYVIGKHAVNNGEGVKLLGAEKYKRDHIGAILEAVLIQINPYSHNNVKVIVLHPDNITDKNFEDLYNSLQGKHQIQLIDDTEITYKVTEIFPMVEPVAALETFLLTQKGEYYSGNGLKMNPGDQVLVVDIGGGLTAFVPTIISKSGMLEIGTNTKTIQAGVQDIIQTFEEGLKNRYEDLSSINSLDSFMITKALHTGFINIRNQDYPCEDEIIKGIKKLAVPIENEYINRYKKGVSFAGIILTGGGGALGFDYLKSNVFHHAYVFPAELSMDKMQVGAIRGASKSFINYLIKQGK